MKIHKSYRVPLDLNNKQHDLFVRHAGTARKAWNWGLGLVKSRYEQKKLDPLVKIPWSGFELQKILNSIKNTKFPWIYQYSKAAPQKALEQLGQAFKLHFKNPQHFKFPKFKKKLKCQRSFELIGKIKICGNGIKLPRIGFVRFLRKWWVRCDIKVNSVTCKFGQGRWWTVIHSEEEHITHEPIIDHIIGVDLGIKSHAVISDGQVFENPRNTKSYEDRLKRTNRSLSRKKLYSQNWKKAGAILNKVHTRISNSRNHSIHQLTSSIIKQHPKAIVIEDLNVEGMKQNRSLAKSVSDAAFGEIRRQFEYKCTWAGIQLILADRFFPSSKTCSACGLVKTKLGLGERVYCCEACGLVIDRDLNAALNLRNLGTANFAGSIPDLGRKPVERRVTTVRENALQIHSMKQEPGSRVSA